MTMKAIIDYGYGRALLWGDFNAETVQREFYDRANQCFGIRKSISGFTLVSLDDEEFPDVFGVEKSEMVALLKHNGDTIAWNAAGDKIRSEFD